MSTRSRIGILNPNGTVTSIYCHSDGYLSYNGKMLLKHYMEESKVQELLNLGDISSLGSEIGEKHDRSCTNDWVFAYARDRGESGTEARVNQSIQHFLDEGQEYNYLFNPVSKQWFWSLGSHKVIPMPRLTLAACEEDE